MCTKTQSADIAHAARVLHNGGTVAFPTDTVYGVGANAFLPKAVEKLYVAKARPREKAIPVLISGIDVLPQVTASIPEIAYELAERFWPGALTLVLRRNAQISNTVTSGSDTVAVRVPDHPLAQALLVALDVPLAATSANISGQPAPVTAQGVLAQLNGRIDLLLDGGTCPGGVASTVLDLTASPPQVLRAGSLLPALESWL
jgi:L-threonylcarbamoyladenylate synthase